MATPATALGIENNLNHPNLQIGQTVVPGEQWLRDFPYYRQQYALHLIKGFRKCQRNIASYLGMNKTGGKIPAGNKAEIRECLRIFSEARKFEIAGIFVRHGFNLDSSSFNACYLSGVEGAASPPSFGVQLLIRFQKDGNDLALIVGYGISADSLKQFVIE